MRRIKRTKKSGLLQNPLFSMAVSLLLVAATIGFVFGFGAFLENQTYTGPEVTSALASTEEKKEEPEYLKVDRRFRPCYVMISSVPPLGLWANPVPGEKTDTSRMLVSGEIVYAEQRGSYKGQMYYKLSDGRYLSTDINHAEPLLSYTEMEGYLAITYISSSGVRLRRWADFDADNVAGAVYVGDKVQIKAKVQTEKGASAYITTNGLYITTDNQYFNDYTVAVESSEKEDGKADKKTGDQKSSGEDTTRRSGTDSSEKEKNSEEEEERFGTERDSEDEEEFSGTERYSQDEEDSGTERDSQDEEDSGTERDSQDEGQSSGRWDFSDPELNRQN